MRNECRAGRAFAAACVALIVAARIASAADVARRDAPRRSRVLSPWSAGLALGPARWGYNERLLDEMKRQGWGDATGDSIYFGIPVPGRAYPYSDDYGTIAVRFWVARRFAGSWALRGEYSNLPRSIVSGNRTGSGSVTIDTDANSLALFVIYGDRVRIGAGPSLDWSVTTENYGDGKVELSPGVTLLAQLTLYAIGPARLSVAGMRHLGASRDIAPYRPTLTGEAFGANGFNMSHSWFGVTLEGWKADN